MFSAVGGFRVAVVAELALAFSAGLSIGSRGKDAVRSFTTACVVIEVVTPADRVRYFSGGQIFTAIKPGSTIY